MAQFSLPVLNTQYETVQKIPTSNWMTALGQGADMVSKAAGQYKDYKDFQEEERKKKEAEQKRKDLEAMLLKGKTDKSELDEKLAELQKKLDELIIEKTEAEKTDASINATNQMQGYVPGDQAASINATNQMQGYAPIAEQPTRLPDLGKLQSNMIPSQTAIAETSAAPINIPEFGFKLPSLETTPTPQTGFMLPQLRGF